MFHHVPLSFLSFALDMVILYMWLFHTSITEVPVTVVFRSLKGISRYNLNSRTPRGLSETVLSELLLLTVNEKRLCQIRRNILLQDLSCI